MNDGHDYSGEATERPGEEEPQIFAVKKSGNHWDLTRRGVIQSAAVAVGAAIAGCEKPHGGDGSSPGNGTPQAAPPAHASAPPVKGSKSPHGAQSRSSTTTAGTHAHGEPGHTSSTGSAHDSSSGSLPHTGPAADASKTPPSRKRKRRPDPDQNGGGAGGSTGGAYGGSSAGSSSGGDSTPGGGGTGGGYTYTYTYHYWRPN